MNGFPKTSESTKRSFIKPFRMLRMPSCKPKNIVAMLALHELLKKRPDLAALRSINACDEKGRTALIRAVKENDATITRILIESGANKECVTKKGRTALSLAVELGHLELVKYLIAENAQLNIKSPQSLNLIHIAAHQGHFDILKMLCNLKDQNGKHCIPLEALTDKGENALFIAAKRGQHKIVGFLLDQRDENNNYLFN